MNDIKSGSKNTGGGETLVRKTKCDKPSDRKSMACVSLNAITFHEYHVTNEGGHPSSRKAVPAVLVDMSG